MYQLKISHRYLGLGLQYIFSGHNTTHNFVLAPTSIINFLFLWLAFHYLTQHYFHSILF